ncbi:putative inorganic phosphate cotransporter isoform X2 [Episyrphus balteatus]|uniref:putative inorganic phosphate cotransporter isoform X2 n=1 Tax=Episyrphus balteatus TaxID=286459 RepID=UPI002484DED4|nr:putative inorganic phosphate cotransporter isoform X2 [Episyrphus balteatus]
MPITKKTPQRLGVRHVQTFMVFLCYLLNFMGRINCSFALVAMTNAKSANPDFPEYKWNEKIISYIISGANIGATLTIIPGSFMCRKFGVKTTMALSTFGTSILSLLTPISIPYGGWELYCVIRLFQGMFQGIFFPCVSQHLANWAPPNEVTRLGALSYNGVSVGIILAMFTSGFIAKSSWGWPGISYFAGGLGIAWNVMWQIYGESTPATSKFISPDEKEFILKSQIKTDGAQRKVPIPWKAIFTSPAFLSCVAMHSAGYWGYVTILLEIPLYMNGILHMDIRSNSIFSSLPFVAVFVMSFIYLFFYNILIKKYSINIAKKIINTLAMWIPAGALIWVGFLDENQKELAIVLMVIIVGINAGVTVGSGMNNIELAPNHAAFLGSILVTMKGVASIIAPLFKGFVVSDTNDRFQWQIVFTVAGLIFFFGNLQFLIFGTTERQPWNDENFLKSNQEQIKLEINREEDFNKSELNGLIEKPSVVIK